MLPRHRGRAPRRHQGARGGRRRLPRAHRVLGGAAARPQGPRPRRPGPRRRGRGARLLGRPARRLPRDPRAALLGAQDRAGPRHPAQAQARGGEGGPRGHLHGRHPQRGARRGDPLRRGLRGVAQGRRQGDRRARRPAHLLRLPRRAPGPPAHHDPIEIDLLDRPPADPGDQGRGSRAAGLAMAFKLLEAAQEQLAPHQRTAARAARAGRGHLHRRSATGTKGGCHPESTALDEEDVAA